MNSKLAKSLRRRSKGHYRNREYEIRNLARSTNARLAGHPGTLQVSLTSPRGMYLWRKEVVST
jgi:hypothetical protein